MKRTSMLVAQVLLGAILAIPMAAADWPARSGTAASRLTRSHATTIDKTGPASGVADSGPQPCRWWQFRQCDDRSDVGADVVGLPDGAPRHGTVITVDLSTNMLYLFQDGALVTKSKAATGSGKVLETEEDVWMFKTPQGHLNVKRKIVHPVWHKPDWAYIEDGKTVPPTNHPSRYVKGHLGKYALDLGEGIMIHGTDDPGSIGRRVSHGCVRLPAAALVKVYKAAKVGTDVFIFQSREPAQVSSQEGSTHHSDLDYGKEAQ